MTFHRLAAVAAVITAGLGATSAAAQANKPLVITHYSGPRSGWALESIDAYTLTRAGCLETLTRYDESGNLAPGLATSWKEIDPTTWEFSLRQDVKFQDGADFNAEAATNALNRVLRATAPMRGFSPKIISAITATGPYTLQVKIPAPSQLTPYRFAAPSTGILSPAAYGASINPIGTCTGPFILTKEVPKQSIELIRNDNYWGEKAKIAKAEFRFILDAGARVAQLRSGEADLSMEIPFSMAYALGATRNLSVSSVPIPRTQTLIFNTTKPPFDNEKARQAVQSALNTESISRAVYEGYAQPAGGPFAPGQPWRPDSMAPVKADPSRALKLLTEAGVDPKALKLSMLVYNDRPDLPEIAQIVQQQLKQIGIQAELRVANYAGIEPEMYAGNFNIAFLSRNPMTDMSDPSAFLMSDYTCEGSYNFSHFCDPAFDELIAKAEGTADQATRHKLYGEIGTQLQKRAISVYLVHTNQVDAHRAALKGFKPDILGYYLLTTKMELK